MGKRKVKTVIRLQIQAGKATPAPPVGTALAPQGINIMKYCKANKERTAAQAGSVVPAEITVFEDRSFTFITKTPPAGDLLKQAAGVEKGSGRPNRDRVGTVTRAQVREIAQLKLGDLNAYDLEQAMRTVEGTARSMGVGVEG